MLTPININKMITKIIAGFCLNQIKFPINNWYAAKPIRKRAAATKTIKYRDSPIAEK